MASMLDSPSVDAVGLADNGHVTKSPDAVSSTPNGETAPLRTPNVLQPNLHHQPLVKQQQHGVMHTETEVANGFVKDGSSLPYIFDTNESGE